MPHMPRHLLPIRAKNRGIISDIFTAVLLYPEHAYIITSETLLSMLLVPVRNRL